MRHSIKTAFRSLRAGKLYTLINVFGLALGITACLLMTTVVLDEWSYDRHWSRSEDLYRMVSISKDGFSSGSKNGAVYAGVTPALKHDFQEVEEYGTLYLQPINFKLNKEDPAPIKLNMLFADSAVQHLLDIDLIQHQDLTPGGSIRKIIVSETFKERYFPDIDPVGRRIYDVPNYSEKANEYLIAGVMKDLPDNTHLRSDIILLQDRKEETLNKGDWGIYVRHYMLLRPGTDRHQFEEKINRWYQTRMGEQNVTQFQLQPIADVYLKSEDIPAYQIIRGNIRHSYIFMGVALLLALIACINFINLSTARVSSRLKETGMRKILGASRRQLIFQFLLEALLTFGFAGCIAIFAYYLCIPFVEQFIGHPLAITFGISWTYTAGAAAALLGVCLLAGLYPAWFISGFKAAGSINKLITYGNTHQGWLRKSLVVAQFSISIAVLVAMLVVQQQIHFMKNKDVGYQPDGLISIDHVSWDGKSDVIRTELEEHPDILSVSFSGWLPTQGAGYMTRSVPDPNDPNKKIELWYIPGDANLAQTLGLQLKEGRYLQADRTADAIDATDLEAEANAIRPGIMTTSTARLLGVSDLNQPLPDSKVVPVGIVEEFNSLSLHRAIVPTVFVGYRNPKYGAMLIRVRPGTEQRVMRAVSGIWNQLYPEKLLDIKPVKETLAAQYETEEKLQSLFGLFSGLTMLLAALGVFGLIVQAVGLRTKEIGIRKVLGASVAGIVQLLSKDFVKLVLCALVVASPIAWWAMNQWLQDFAYRIEIQLWVFALAGLAAVVIALLTVSFQATKAAVANPVDSLRDE